MKDETMDKLRCDICGGILTMQSNSKTAVCDSCGMQYSVERLREKVQEIKGTVSVEGTVQTQDADFIVRGGVLERYNGNDTDVVIPDSVVKIGERAFEGCTELKSVTTSLNTVKIGRSAFAGFQALEKIELLNGLTEIGEYSFSDCCALKRILLPETVRKIGERAFWRCTALEAINIPEQAVCYTGAFESCSALREVIITETKKEKLFGNGIWRIQNIFEEKIDDSDDGDWHYSCGHCGFWYLHVRHQFKEKELKRVQGIREERKTKNVCQYCGGSFAGFFTLKCTNCGRRKDY